MTNFESELNAVRAEKEDARLSMQRKQKAVVEFRKAELAAAKRVWTQIDSVMRPRGYMVYLPDGGRTVVVATRANIHHEEYGFAQEPRAQGYYLTFTPEADRPAVDWSDGDQIDKIRISSDNKELIKEIASAPNQFESAASIVVSNSDIMRYLARFHDLAEFRGATERLRTGAADFEKWTKGRGKEVSRMESRARSFKTERTFNKYKPIIAIFIVVLLTYIVLK